VALAAQMLNTIRRMTCIAARDRAEDNVRMYTNPIVRALGATVFLETPKSLMCFSAPGRDRYNVVGPISDPAPGLFLRSP